MKYLVMECHNGYAVLMDEAANIVKAANLHYEVGQTVTEPVLMREPDRKASITQSVIVRITAAAACLLLLSAGGFRYYLTKLKTESTILLSSDLQIEMQVNSLGEVIGVQSSTDNGKAVLQNYHSRQKEITIVTNELIALQKDCGYIADGDTVDVYIQADDNNAYETYKADVETEMSKMSLHANVQDMMQKDQPAKVPAANPEPAVTKPADPPAPATPTAPAAPEAPVTPPAPGQAPQPGIETPPAPHEDKEKDKDEPKKPDPAAPGIGKEPGHPAEPPAKGTEVQPPQPGTETPPAPHEDDREEVKPTEPVHPVHPPLHGADETEKIPAAKKPVKVDTPAVPVPAEEPAAPAAETEAAPLPHEANKP